MRTTFLLLAFCVLVWPAAALAGPEDSVVRIFSSQRFPSILRPWASQQSSVDVFATGTVIEGKRILTNAHLVLYATEVHVQPRRGGAKVEAKVEMVAPDMDLAILSVKDAKFFEKHAALPRAKKLPKTQDSVAVYGFPVGGNDLSVTKGVVSRIEYGRYYQQGLGLIVQVSAAINPGNSGGPAVVGDKMIGLVMSRHTEGENIGYVIPNEEIDLFLEDIKDGRYDGKPTETAGTEFHRLENPALRSFLKIDDSVRGVLVSPPRRRPANYPFEEFDVLTKIGPHEIDNDGMVQLPDDLRLGFFSVLSREAKGGAVPVTLIRKGKRIEASLPVDTRDNRLIRDFKGEKLPYFIHGPLVFAPAKVDAIPMYARMRPDLEDVQSPLISRFADRVELPGEELVVVTSPMFKHAIAKGYADPAGQVVKEVNGTKIKSLKHLVEIFRDCTDDYLMFRFDERGSEVLVFRREEMNKATDEILDDNGISP
ncbi:MAG TPA: trypsin-like peptidase domain-containing protein, partial [Gemmataceae bacterium]|nr:trypsin-like peptidase domain-containing protein [Gemmataceae bacterium]